MIRQTLTYDCACCGKTNTYVKKGGGRDREYCDATCRAKAAYRKAVELGKYGTPGKRGGGSYGK